MNSKRKNDGPIEDDGTLSGYYGARKQRRLEREAESKQEGKNDRE